MIWIYNEKEILCTQKYTISPDFGMIGVTKEQIRYSNNQVVGQQEKYVMLLTKHK